MEMLNSYLISIGGIGAIFICINTLLYGIIIAPYFDKLFPKFVNSETSIESGYWLLSPILRGARYGGLMIFKSGKNKAYNRHYFGSFDFRKHARFIDWVIVSSNIIAISICGLLGLIDVVINYYFL